MALQMNVEITTEENMQRIEQVDLHFKGARLVKETLMPVCATPDMAHYVSVRAPTSFPCKAGETIGVWTDTYLLPDARTVNVSHFDRLPAPLVDHQK